MTQSINLWNQLPDLVWKDRVALAAFQLDRLGEPLPLVTHVFAPGIYIREMEIPEDTLFLGREHLVGHWVQLVEGKLTLLTPAGSQAFEAPAQVHTWPGYHMVVITTTKVRARSLHPNLFDLRDTKALEDLYFGSVESILERGEELQRRLKW
jgi:hypothetical protein